MIIQFREGIKTNIESMFINRPAPRLQELGDKPSALTLESDDSELISYSAVVNEKLYEFQFVRLYDDPVYLFRLYAGNTPVVLDIVEKYPFPEEIIFYDYSFFYIEAETYKRTTDITNTGDATLVFSTALSAYEHFFQRIQNKFDVLHFSAKEANRRRIYDIFAMKLHRERGLTVEVFEKDYYKHYMIINESHLGVEDADERKWLV